MHIWLYARVANWLFIVDKVIIDQQSLRSFVNTLLPGAYQSVTKIDFTALDQLPIRPVGLYGSRPQIVEVLLEEGYIAPDM